MVAFSHLRSGRRTGRRIMIVRRVLWCYGEAVMEAQAEVRSSRGFEMRRKSPSLVARSTIPEKITPP
jgi:hypothetical protein